MVWLLLFSVVEVAPTIIRLLDSKLISEIPNPILLFSADPVLFEVDPLSISPSLLCPGINNYSPPLELLLKLKLVFSLASYPRSVVGVPLLKLGVPLLLYAPLWGSSALAKG